MNAEDLMIHDLIFSKGKEIHTVLGLDEDENSRWWYYSKEHQSWCAVDEAIPIPLTEEILEKNKFMKWSWYKRGQINKVITYSIGDGFNLELKDDGTFELVDNVRDDGDYGYEANYICEIKYVHELQHIMKVLKIKKQIAI